MCIVFFVFVAFLVFAAAIVVVLVVAAKKDTQVIHHQYPPQQLYPPQPYPPYQQLPPAYQQGGYAPPGPVGQDAGYPPQAPSATVQPWGAPGTIPGAPAGVAAPAPPPGRGPQTRVVSPEMVYLQGPTGAMEALPQGETSVGRDDDNAIMVVDGGASRHHATVRRAGTTVEIVDLGSGNGTFVNDFRIASGVPCQVRQGDRVRFGGPSLYIVGGAT